MDTKKFISFNEETKKVTISLTYNVTESDVKFQKKLPQTSIIKGVCIAAIQHRIRHCKNVLTNEILSQEDKVFTNNIIFSNVIGKHFSIPAFEIMESLEARMLETTDFRHLLYNLQDAEICQLLKAIANLPCSDNDEKETREYLLSFLIEVAIMKGRE